VLYTTSAWSVLTARVISPDERAHGRERAAIVNYLIVGLGSALGGMSRYGLGLLAARLWGEAFPWGTLLINVLGSFVIGWMGAATAPTGIWPGSPTLRLLIMVGVCGGFTTFSSFSLQTLLLAREGQPVWALGNILLSVALCLGSVALGSRAGARPRAVFGEAASPHVLVVLDPRDQAQPVLDAAAQYATARGTRIVLARIAAHSAGAAPGLEVSAATALPAGDAQVASLKPDIDAWRTAHVPLTLDDGTGPLDPLFTGAALVAFSKRAATSALLRTALIDSTRPVLIVPDHRRHPAFTTIAVAWWPQPGLDRALAAATPLLLRADAVAFLTIADEPPAPPPPPLVATLQAAGVTVSSRHLPRGDATIGAALLTAADQEGADLLVMGAYGQAPMAQALFGGVTRTVLAHSDQPVLLTA
jgi:CrcB protein